MWLNLLLENKIYYWYWFEYGLGGLCFVVEVSFFYVSFDVLDNDLLLVFLGGKDGVERYYVSFIGREVD